MPCYYPVTLYKSRLGPNKETGKWPLVGLRDGYRDRSEKVPCGRCIGCRLERSRQWAIRCVHEIQMKEDNCFLTLTYDNEHLVYKDESEIPTLHPRDLQLFMKRLRKEFGNGIRFFACGEYGGVTHRPHYHALIFGFDFKDKKYFTTSGDNHLYTSDSLNRIWTHGHCIIGNATFESAAYVARYIVDKKLGQQAEIYTELKIEPEFIRMSRRPGIGATWLQKYQSDVFPHDYVVIRDGLKCKPPKFYSNRYELANPEQFKQIKSIRKDEQAKSWKNNTTEKLKIREYVKKQQIKNLTRKM